MQAIVTKYIPATNTRGSRIKAQCDAKTIIRDWPARLNMEDAHTFVAVQLVRELGWAGESYGGRMMRAGMPQKGSHYAYVFILTGGKSAEWDGVEVNDAKWDGAA